jgi:hypothetical protein
MKCVPFVHISKKWQIILTIIYGTMYAEKTEFLIFELVVLADFPHLMCWCIIQYVSGTGLVPVFRLASSQKPSLNDVYWYCNWKRLNVKLVNNQYSKKTKFSLQRAPWYKCLCLPNYALYLLGLESIKIYLKFTLKCCYMFRSMTIIRELVYNDVFLPNFLTIVTLARFKYELPDYGHRPKHVAAF